MRNKVTVIISIILLLGIAFALAVSADAGIYLSELPIKSASIISGYKVGVDKNIFGGALKVDGVSYSRGISTHPVALGEPSEITFDISEYSTQYNLFSATAGKDASTDLGENDNGTYKCAFYVKADGKYVYTSGEMTCGGAQSFTVVIEGVKELTLGVTDCGVFAFLTFDFCDARLYKGKVPEECEPAPDADHANLDGAKYLSELTYSDFRMYGTNLPGVDEDGFGGDIVIASGRYDHGIALNPGDDYAYIKYDISSLTDDYNLFYAVCGKDDYARGVSTFSEMYVYADGIRLGYTEFITYGSAYVLCADIKGVKELELRVTSGGDSSAWDLSAFGDACLLKREPQNIELVSAPYKTEYKPGSTLNPYGGLLKIDYGGGLVNELNIRADMLFGFVPENYGKQTVKINYSGHEFEYNVTVWDENAPETTSSDTETYATADTSATEPKINDSKVNIVPLMIALGAVIVITVVVYIILKGRKK